MMLSFINGQFQAEFTEAIGVQEKLEIGNALT